MGVYKYIRDAWKDQKNKVQKQRLISWRKEPVTVRVDKPTRLDRARSLGYRAKPGILIVRQRVKRGGRMRPQIRKGRRSKNQRRKKILGKSYQQVAEERAASKYKNCEVLNSYKVGDDGKSFWFEVILVDRFHPQIINDDKLSWITLKKDRAGRGLTSSGKKSRGMHKKGKGTERIRPSKRANRQ